VFNPSYSDDRNKHLFKQELLSIAERMVNDHRARIRRKKVDEIKFMVFKKGGTFENRNGFVEKSIENSLRYYVAGQIGDN